MNQQPRVASCPNCYGMMVRALDRHGNPLLIEVSWGKSFTYRTSRGKTLPQGFVVNVVCPTCPLRLDLDSFRRVWFKNGQPSHVPDAERAA